MPIRFWRFAVFAIWRCPIETDNFRHLIEFEPLPKVFDVLKRILPWKKRPEWKSVSARPIYMAHYFRFRRYGHYGQFWPFFDKTSTYYNNVFSNHFVFLFFLFLFLFWFLSFLLSLPFFSLSAYRDSLPASEAEVETLLQVPVFYLWSYAVFHARRRFSQW